MATLSYLSDVIGPRLTGSPNLKRANEWTRQKLEGWGLTNAHLEPWGPFGRGWEVKRFSAQVIEPQDFPIIAYPLAWSPGYNQPMVGDAVFIDLATTTNLDQYKGKLEGAMVLISPMRTNLSPPFQPLAVRLADSNLLGAANSVDDLGFFGMIQSRGGGGRRGGAASQFERPRISPARLLSVLDEEKVGVRAEPPVPNSTTGRYWCRAPRFRRAPMRAAADSVAAEEATPIRPTRRPCRLRSPSRWRATIGLSA